MEIKGLAQRELGNHDTVLGCLQAHPGKWIGSDAFTDEGKKAAKRLAAAGVVAVGTYVSKQGTHIKAYKLGEPNE